MSFTTHKVATGLTMERIGSLLLITYQEQDGFHQTLTMF